MSLPDRYHNGEIAVQKLANEFDSAQVNGRVISENIPGGAIPFLAQLNLVWISSIDAQGNIWCSPLFGYPGFISAPSANSLIIDKTKLLTNDHDPFWQNLETHRDIGILALEQSTRRRLRVNGFITSNDDMNIKIKVAEAYPNCPKYITRRGLQILSSDKADNIQKKNMLLTSSEKLNSNQKLLIENSDSFFVASGVPQDKSEDKSKNNPNRFQCDASHRGGYPGFVEIKDDSTLVIPDYKGNSMFNTLGNIHQYNRACLMFFDYEKNQYLQLSGRASILWEQADPQKKSAGTKRFWQLQIEQCHQYQLTNLIEWNFLDYSPHNPRPTKEKTAEIFNLKVTKVTVKGDRIKLFRLASANNTILPAFEPGAHLPIKLTLENGENILRHYSILSSSHDNRFYEIAVQREDNGRGGSKFIHQKLTTDSVIQSTGPVNHFPMQPIGQHNILIAGGIGITPILSMARELSEANKSFEVHYAASTQKDLVFEKELLDLAGNNAHFYFSTGENARRLNIEELLKHHQSETHVFICGPNRMLQAVRETAEIHNWQPQQIHFESFGASSSKDDQAFQLKLSRSAKVIKVQAQQTILEALEASSIQVPNDCRRGECGMCVTNIKEGEVEHRDVYLTKEDKKTQMCVCVSRAKGNSLVLDL